MQKKIRCQCPECHCTKEFDEKEETQVDLHPMSNESMIDTEKDFKFLLSKTHLAVCPMCYAGEHEIFE